MESVRLRDGYEKVQAGELGRLVVIQPKTRDLKRLLEWEFPGAQGTTVGSADSQEPGKCRVPAPKSKWYQAHGEVMAHLVILALRMC